MESPGKNLLKFLVEHDPASPEFRNEVRAALFPEPGRTRHTCPTVVSGSAARNVCHSNEFDLWRDVFVQQKLPWGRFLQSTLLHATAVTLIWTISFAWIRQQKILAPVPFDRSALVTYTPQEYLPPLDTGAPEAPKPQKGEPAYAKQPILSVPKEADNRSQTIVVPPDLKLNHDIPLPNIIATAAIAPAVPLDATRYASTSRIVAPETQVVAPAPDVQFTRDRVVRAGLKSDVIAPPPEVSSHQTRGLATPETAVVEPPPELTQAPRGHVGLMNIGPSEVVAPAPQLTLAEQHAASRGSGHNKICRRRRRAAGRPSAESGRSGYCQRRWTIDRSGNSSCRAHRPCGCSRRQSAGNISPQIRGESLAPRERQIRRDRTRPQTVTVLAHTMAALPVGPAGGRGRSGWGRWRAMASLSAPGTHPNARVAPPLSDDKITDVDRQVFGGKRVYGRTLNMPNLNSSTGSWVIKFAELGRGRKDGELLEPLPRKNPTPAIRWN